MKIKFIRPFRFIGNNPDDGSDDTVPAGHIVDLENDESAQWLIDNGFAKEVDLYWYVDADGITMSRRWTCDFFDERLKAIGNVFKTRESANRFIGYLKAVEAVRHDEGFMKQDKTYGKVWELRRAYLDSEELFTARMIEYEGFHHLGAFYFDTEEHAIASSDKHPKEWGTIMNYDWSKGEDEEEDED